MSTFAPGATFDRYELVRCVGSGGMGSVWLALYNGAFGFRKRVALKAILPEHADDAHYRKMFLDEANVMSRLHHPNAVQVLDIVEDQGLLFIALEWVDGQSMDHLLRRGEGQKRPAPLGIVLRILADAAAGLHAAHELVDEQGESLGVIHRDVSPHNILVGDAGHTKVIDFGIAFSTVRNATATRTGLAKGKPNYLAPEQAMRFDTDRRADVWGLGATLYRALAAHPPFASVEHVVEYVYQKAPLARIAEPPPDAVRDILARALAVEPRHRYPTAEAMREALESALAAIGGTSAADVARYVASVGSPTADPSGTRDAADATRDLAPTTTSTRREIPR